MATEHIERIANIVASEPITSGGAIGSGSYIVDGQSDLDITVTEGASVRLIVASDAAAADINIDVERGARPCARGYGA